MRHLILILVYWLAFGSLIHAQVEIRTGAKEVNIVAGEDGNLVIRSVPRPVVLDPGAPPLSGPTITTTSLSDGDQDVAYSANLAATGGQLPYTWSLVATETLPQMGEVWTPLSADFALIENFGDNTCSGFDNVWPVPGGMTVVGGSLFTGTCSGYKDAAGANAVIQNGLSLTRAWTEDEILIESLPASETTVVASWRSATNGNLIRVWYRLSTGNLEIFQAGGTGPVIGPVAIDTKYKLQIFGERGSGVANDAKAHARLAVWNGSSYDAFGAWVEDNTGTWTDPLSQYLYPIGLELRVDTHRRCQLGAIGSGACSTNPPDLYTTPSPKPCAVYVDDSDTPIDEALWSHDGTDLTLEIATDPDLSVIEVAECPGDLTLSPTGVLSGTPTAAGTFNFTARVCDVNTLCDTQALSIDINAPPDPDPPGPWVTGFTPARIHYVTVNGSGSQNGDINNPESAATAFTNSHLLCGDLHNFRAGTYDRMELLSLTDVCTSGAPQVFKGYVDPATGQPENVIWRFEVAQPGPWIWFVNLHNTLIGATTNSLGGFQLRKAGGKVINSIAHDVQSVNIASFRNPGASDPGIVMYGNITYRAGPGTNGAHNYYIHNDYDAQGYKYFIQIISLESQGNNGRRMFQVNDSHGDRGMSGIWMEDSFVGDGNPVTNPSSNPGQSMVWDSSGAAQWVVAKKTVLKNNYFVDFFHSSSERNSIRTQNVSMQAEITGNYFARANLRLDGYLGNQGTHDPFIFQNNEIYDPPLGIHLALFKTRRETSGSAGADGSFKIRDADVWNNNTYSTPFQAQPHCNNTNSGTVNLATWRTATDACRVTPASAVGFDINSTEVPIPTTDKVAVLKNEYQCPTCVFNDQARGNIYCINWDGDSTCIANISGVVGPGKDYVIRYPRDFFGTFATSGTCPSSGPCNATIPTRRTSGEASGKFANAWVITGEP